MPMGQSNGSDQWVRPVGHTDGSNQGGQSDQGQTSWFHKCVTPVGQSEVSAQWVGDQQVALMGHADGSEQWVRLVGETSESQ